MKRILVCDDEPHISEGLRYLLRGPGREVQVARCGEQALAMIQEQVPDLLILDVMMPGMSGPEVLSILRKQPATAHLPVIVLTAKAYADNGVIAQELWDATMIAKPFAPARLRESVTRLLEMGACPQASCT